MPDYSTRGLAEVTLHSKHYVVMQNNSRKRVIYRIWTGIQCCADLVPREPQGHYIMNLKRVGLNAGEIYKPEFQTKLNVFINTLSGVLGASAFTTISYDYQNVLHHSRVNRSIYVINR